MQIGKAGCMSQFAEPFVGVCGFGHFFTGQCVFRFFAGRFQMPEGESDGVDGQCVTDGLVMDVPVGFDGMADGVFCWMRRWRYGNVR